MKLSRISNQALERVLSCNLWDLGNTIQSLFSTIQDLGIKKGKHPKNRLNIRQEKKVLELSDKADALYLKLLKNIFDLESIWRELGAAIEALECEVDGDLGIALQTARQLAAQLEGIIQNDRALLGKVKYLIQEVIPLWQQKGPSVDFLSFEMEEILALCDSNQRQRNKINPLEVPK